MPKFDSNLILASIEEEALKQGVDPNIAKAIFRTETNGAKQVDSDATSPKDAYGLMQIIPSTWSALVNKGLVSPTDDQRDPKVQIKAGVALLKDNQKIAKTPAEQAAYYNGGTAALTALRNGQPLNPETAAYLPKFGAFMGTDNAIDPAPSMTPTKSTTATRESYSVHQKTIPTEVMADLQRSSEDYGGLSAGTIRQLQALASTIIPNAEEQSKAVDAQGNAKVQQINAQTTLDQAELTRRQQVTGAFGIDLNDPENIIAKSQIIVNSAHNEREQLQGQITALSSKSPLTDPVGWLMDSLKAAPLINRHNALLQMEGSANSRIQNAQAEGTAQMNLQPANVKDALNTKNMADVNAALADATAKKAAITGAARTQLAQTLGSTLQLAGGDLNRKIQMADLVSKTTSESYSTTDREAQANEKYKLLNFNLAQIGLPAYTEDTFKNLEPATKQRLIKYGQGAIHSPGETLSLIYDIGGDQSGTMMRDAPLASQFIKDIVGHGLDTYSTESKKTQTDVGTKAQLARIKTPQESIEFGVNKWAGIKEEELKGGNMLSLSKDNPYRLNAGVVAANSAMQSNPVAQEILKNSQKGASAFITPPKVDEQWVLGAMGAKVANGELSTADAAAAIQDFYTRGNQIQRATTGMNVLGFKELKNYPVSTKLYGDSMPVELTSRQSIDNFLTRQIIALKNSALLGNAGTTPAIGNPMGDFQQ